MKSNADKLEAAIELFTAQLVEATRLGHTFRARTLEVRVARFERALARRKAEARKAN